MGFYLHNLYLAFNFLIFRCAKLILQVFGARSLAVADFGLFSYLYTLTDIWVHLFGFGVDVVASRAHKEGEDWPSLWKRAAILKGALSLLGLIIGLIMLPWPYALLFGFWHVGFMQSKLAYNYVNTLLYPRGIVIAGAVAEIGLLVVALAATKAWGLTGFVLAFAAERCLEAACLWFFTLKQEPRMRSDWSLQGLTQAAKSFFSGASLIWATQLLGILAARIDSVIVKKLLGLESVALYSISFRAAEAPLFIFAAMADSTLAYSIRHREEQEAIYVQNLKRAFAIGLLLAAGLTVFGHTVAEWLLGPKYEGIAPILAGYAWVMALRGPNMVSSSFLMASHREKLLLASSGVGLFFNIAANIVLIPHFGVKAPVMTAIVTESLIFLIRAQKTLNKWVPWTLVCVGLLGLSVFFLYR